MKLKFILPLLLSTFIGAPAWAQDNTEVPARVSDYVFTEAPDDHVIGADDAVQTIITYASVTCPHCGSWFTEEWPVVKTELVETGLIRFVFREFPTAPAALSMTGFMMANCAPAEDYFEIIEYQMENQAQIFKDAQEGRGREAYNKIAAKAGMMDDDAINACLTNPDMAAQIQDNSARANLGNVKGVPAFFINGQLYNGQQDAKTLVELIKEMDARGLTALPDNIVAKDAHDGHEHD